MKRKILIGIIIITLTSCVENTSSKRRVANRKTSNHKVIHTIRLLTDNAQGLETYEYFFNSDSTWIEFTCFDDHNHKIPVNTIRDIKTE